MSKPIKTARELAVICALEVERKSLLVPEAMGSLPFSLSEEDRNLAHEIVYGTFRYLPGLTTILGKLCKPKKLPPKIRWLLLTSLYQLRYLRVPTYAVIDEANKLAMSMGFRGLKALVNGVLRNADRKKDTLGVTLGSRDWLLPLWMSELLERQYGQKEVAGWLESWGERGTTSYWTIDGSGLEGDTSSEYLPHAWRRNRPIPIEAYDTQKLYVQNESSQAIAELACRLKVESVLDLCAAPGGKICYVAAFSDAKRLVANDQSSERLARMKQNRERLGLSFETTCQDGRDGSFDSMDLVMLDAPCSGIGIIGRHPEIKFLKKEPADQTLKSAQASLMEAAWNLVRPGGYLLYTVCSLDQKEIPDLPADGEVVLATENHDLVEGLPFKMLGDRFYVAPTSVFDGFSGTLLRKRT